MKDLQEKSDEHKIDLESLNNFLFEKGDSFCDTLLQIKSYKKIDYSSDNIQKYYYTLKFKDVNSFPKQLWYYDSFCEKMLGTDSGNIRLIPKTSNNYYNFCKMAVSNYPFNLKHIDSDFIDYNLCKIVVSNIYRTLNLIPKQFIDYNLCKLAVSNNYSNLQYVPKNIENYYLICLLAVYKKGSALEFVPKNIDKYYTILKLAFETYRYIIIQDWFPKEYIPRLIKDFPEDKEFLEQYILKEYISKEVKKFLKEYLFKEKLYVK